MKQISMHLKPQMEPQSGVATARFVQSVIDPEAQHSVYGTARCRVQGMPIPKSVVGFLGEWLIKLPGIAEQQVAEVLLLSLAPYSHTPEKETSCQALFPDCFYVSR